MSMRCHRTCVISAARGWIGTPYHHQQSAKGRGVDCLGLVRGVWREVVGPEAASIPNYGASWKAGGEDVLLKALHIHMIPAKNILGGVVLVFRYRHGLPASHLAIATSSRTMVHAYHKRGVFEVDISRWWRGKLAAVFEFPMQKGES